MGWACPRRLWPFSLMRRREQARGCNHFYIILGHHCIIRKGWFPWPQQGLKLQALPQTGFRKETEIELASFCPCVPQRYKVSVRWRSSHHDTLQPMYQHPDGKLLCGVSCFLNQLPKLQLCYNLFSMQYGWTYMTTTCCDCKWMLHWQLLQCVTNVAFRHQHFGHSL